MDGVFGKVTEEASKQFFTGRDAAQVLFSSATGGLTNHFQGGNF